jgi:hypothetical protein
MTSEQFNLLLQDLARVAGLSDASGLLEHGRVKIGELDAVLVHEPSFDPDLLQVRIRLSTLPAQSEELTRALLEANYISGYGGECVFSLFPASDDVVITLRVKLESAMTAQELWQGISDVARHASQMWEGIAASAQMLEPARSASLLSAPGMHA